MKTKITAPEVKYAAFVGIDWGDRTHRVCLRAADGTCDEERTLTHDPLALQAWAFELQARFRGDKIAVALEQSRGALIYALMRHAHLVLFPVNPAKLAKFREAATAASGLKDDPLDARLVCELLRLHRDWLRPLPVLPAAVRELQLLCEARRDLVGQRTRLQEQLMAALKGYFPQALALVNDLASPLCWELLRRWPSLAALQKARSQTLARFYREHGVHSEQTIAERLALVRAAVPLTDDAAVTAALPVLVLALVAQMQALHPLIADYDRRISGLFAQQPDASLFASFPGAGPQLAPRLCVAFGPDRSRYHCAEQIQCYSGIAPIKKKSGEGLDLTLWRWHCPTFLRQTFFEFASCSVPQSKWARAFYNQQIQRGKKSAKVKRALAYKWQRILFRCWQTAEPYDEARYIAGLRKRNSPLVPYIDALEPIAA